MGFSEEMELRAILCDLDACSPKDAPGGTTPITSMDEIWRRIACSQTSGCGYPRAAGERGR